MFKLINSGLFNIKSEDDHNDFGDFVKTEILTSRDVVVDQSKSKDRLYPAQRTLLRIVCPSKNYNEFKHSVSSRTNAYGSISVLLKSDERNNYDSNIVAIAFPFNGIIDPIPESRQYRIRKGLIVPSSEFSINFNGKKYKKILYLIIEPHMNILNTEHAHHVPSIDIPITSYAFIMKDGIKDTTKETMTAHITLDGVDATWTSEPCDEIDAAQFKNRPLYVSYNSDKPHGEASRESNNSSRTNVAPIQQPRSFGPNGDSTRTNTYQPSSKKTFKDESDYNDHPSKKTGNKGKRSKKRR